MDFGHLETKSTQNQYDFVVGQLMADSLVEGLINVDTSRYCNGDVPVLRRAHMKRVILAINLDILTACAHLETDQ